MAPRAKVTRVNEAPGVSRAIVEPVAAALAQMGFVPRDGVGEWESQAGELISGPAADSLISAAAVQLGDEAVGLSLAERMPIGALGLLDYALCTSTALREALRRVATHYAVATQRVELTLAEGPGEANLMFRRKPGLTHSRHWIEFSVAVIAERIRQTVGERLAFDVEFAHDPPRRLTRHRRFFGGRVTFSMPCDRLTLEPSLLDRPLRTASAALAEVLDARLSELEAVAPAADPFLDRVRRAVLSSLDAADPGLPRTLALLQMSRRTFQRQLQRRKTSYKHLLDEARRARASSLLDKDLTVAEVSERLGFSEPSAFFRAFRRWTGGSPKGNVAPSARRAPPS